MTAPSESCPFCRIVRGEAPAWVVHETPGALAFLDAAPAAPYHALVVPKRHVADAFEAPPEAFAAVMGAAKQTADLYRRRLGLEAVELAVCSGAAAQQAVPHLHVHVVPRHAGDGLDTHWPRRPALHADPAALLARLR